MKRYKLDHAIPEYTPYIKEAHNGDLVKYEEVLKILYGAKILLMAAKADCISKPTDKRIQYFLDNSLKDI